ncbi:WW domain-binding protein 4 [Strongyloides ratti]|uniref:WW domain-binding protein 4 n=1 Tax=Strongyloides ratti TaxID=34506 RepID=A0A090LRB7_STRRB|nr:WW domain-binding protein 4 [Strongyloides ratti]CEF70141.1 WW domain-binding protein 4 [Strongyloides ratti]
MADYWKSIPKLWCTTCKCFYAGNNIGITNHERSNKHQNSLRSALRNSAKIAEDTIKKQSDINHAIIQMEQAALASMRNEKSGNTNLSALQQGGGRYGVDGIGPFIPVVSTSIPSTSNSNTNNSPVNDFKQKIKKLIKESKKSSLWTNENVEEETFKSMRCWVEYNSAQGKYYFNMFTHLTQWEKPESFYTQDEYEEMISKSFQSQDYLPSTDDISNVVDKEPIIKSEPITYKKLEEEKKEKQKELLYDPKSIGRIIKDKTKKRKIKEEIKEIKKEEEPKEKKAVEHNFDYEIPKITYATPITLGPWITIKKEEENTDIQNEKVIDYSKELPPEANIIAEESALKTYDDEPIEITDKIIDVSKKKKTISFQKRSSKSRNIRHRDDDNT